MNQKQSTKIETKSARPRQEIYSLGPEAFADLEVRVRLRHGANINEFCVEQIVFQNVSNLSSRSCEVLISSSCHVSHQKCRLRKSMVWSSYSSASGEQFRSCAKLVFCLRIWKPSEALSSFLLFLLFLFFLFDFCISFLWHPLTTLAFGALGLLRLPFYSAAWSKCQEVSEMNSFFHVFVGEMNIQNQNAWKSSAWKLSHSMLEVAARGRPPSNPWGNSYILPWDVLFCDCELLHVFFWGQFKDSSQIPQSSFFPIFEEKISDPVKFPLRGFGAGDFLCSTGASEKVSSLM